MGRAQPRPKGPREGPNKCPNKGLKVFLFVSVGRHKLDRSFRAERKRKGPIQGAFQTAKAEGKKDPNTQQVPIDPIGKVAAVASRARRMGRLQQYTSRSLRVQERLCLSKALVVIDIGGLTEDGRSLPCRQSCGRGRGPLQVFHGTSGSSALGIIRSRGLFEPAINTAAHKIGFYHSAEFNTALWYSRAFLVAGLYSVHPVFQVQASCANTCKDWTYTKRHCTRYHTQRLWLVPASLVKLKPQMAAPAMFEDANLRLLPEDSDSSEGD